MPCCARVGVMVAMSVLAVASSARAVVRPPTDSLRVEVRWIDRTGPLWQARLRLAHYTTTAITPGGAAYAALALRTVDSLTVTGVDSARVELPGTRVPVPGFVTLIPNVATTAALRTHASAPAGGAWRGLLGGAATASVLPNLAVDVCAFIRVIAGTTDAALAAVVRSASVGSATATGVGALNSNVAFKNVWQVRTPTAGGGSDESEMAEP